MISYLSFIVSAAFFSLSKIDLGQVSTYGDTECCAQAEEGDDHPKEVVYENTTSVFIEVN